MTIRVAQCVYGLDPGGAQKVMLTLIEGRTSPAIEYVVYAFVDGLLRRDLERMGIRVHVLPQRTAKLDPTLVVRLGRAFRRDGIDLVHTHLLGDSLHGLLAARLFDGLPVVMTLHCLREDLPRLQRWGYEYLLRRAEVAVGCSRLVSESFAGLARKEMAIRNGIAGREPVRPMDATRLRRELGIERTGPIAMAIGRLAPQKGFDLLLRSVALLKRESSREAQLVIVGDGTERKALEQQAEAEGIAELVHFVGFRSDIDRLLEVADVVVVPSRSEGFPITVLEAMSHGRCLVASDLPGILEAARAERECLAAPVGDVAGLARALHRALSDPELRRRIGEAARRRFEDSFTAETMIKSYEAVYREVVNARPRRRK